VVTCGRKEKHQNEIDRDLNLGRRRKEKSNVRRKSGPDLRDNSLGKLRALLQLDPTQNLWVQRLVAITDNNVELSERKPPEYVEVTKINELVNHIKNNPKRLETREIAQIETEIKNGIQADQ